MQKKIKLIKSVLSIILLTLFSLRPAYQVGCYAYYELNIDTIIEKYCENTDRPELNCDGKCYLAKTLKMQQAQSRSDSKEQAVTMLVEAFFPLYFENSTTFELYHPQIIKHHINSSYFYSLKTDVLDVVKPPPRYLNT